MPVPSLTSGERRGLIALSLAGILGPNGVFLGCLLSSPKSAAAALLHPITGALLVEALILMLLGAWLMRRAGITRPGSGAFVALSLFGSLLFSIPLALLLADRARRSRSHVRRKIRTCS